MRTVARNVADDDGEPSTGQGGDVEKVAAELQLVLAWVVGGGDGEPGMHDGQGRQEALLERLMDSRHLCLHFSRRLRCGQGQGRLAMPLGLLAKGRGEQARQQAAGDPDAGRDDDGEGLASRAEVADRGVEDGAGGQRRRRADQRAGQHGGDDGGERHERTRYAEHVCAVAGRGDRREEAGLDGHADHENTPGVQRLIAGDGEEDAVDEAALAASSRAIVTGVLRGKCIVGTRARHPTLPDPRGRLGASLASAGPP